VCLFQKGTVATHLETECSFRAAGTQVGPDHR